MTADPSIPNDPMRATEQELRADHDRAAARWERLDAEYTMMLDDPGAIQEDRDNVRSLLEEARRTLDVADAALVQLAGGTYGRCVGCGAAIDPERLDALPGTTMCVTCQTGA
jgi:RNA polymerase-binding transcription factor DksA